MLAELLVLLACKAPAVTAVDDVHQVRFRPVPTPSATLAIELTDRVPSSSWDAGLARATELLVAKAVDPNSRIPPLAQASALSYAGYPGHAQFGRELNGGALPSDLIQQMADFALASDAPVDVALKKREYADGTTLWIAAIARRTVLLDPVPQDIALDDAVPVTVEQVHGNGDLTLYLARPDGRVDSWPIEPLIGRWLTEFHTPGEYRAEVVANSGSSSSVVLLWSFFVEDEPIPIPALPVAELSSSADAAEQLYKALNTTRRDNGLPALERFEPYEPLAREHAAYMAHTGRVGHALPNVTDGVAARAARNFLPQADHHENVATALTWQDAHDMVWLSPGHRRNLLCEPCTHVAIGTALGVADRVPQLYVTWEMLEFPNGPPAKL